MTHWDQQAKKWEKIGPPLKPSSIDIQNHLSWIKTFNETFLHPLNVLILGVTPELINMPWPQKSTLYALDNNKKMLDLVLPKETSTIKPIGINGDWLVSPFKNQSFDMVLGDGCFSLIHQENYARLLKEIHRILKPNGMFIMRFFIRPSQNESLAMIHDDLKNGSLTNFHVFKFRIAMALHTDLSLGISLKKVWNCWHDYFKSDVLNLLKTLNWHDEEIDTINHYKDSDVHYTFPTQSEIEALLSQHFIQKDLFIPGYYFGERFPTFKLFPKVSA